MTKEQKQIIMLAILLCGIIGVLIYFNLDRFLPKVVGGSAILPATTRINISTAEADALFERQDYLELQEFGQVPVRPMGLGNNTPFRSETENP
ncbi:MAG: hypothetical protein V1738_01350 [Patescibacteria group bacterium]